MSHAPALDTPAAHLQQCEVSSNVISGNWGRDSLPRDQRLHCLSTGKQEMERDSLCVRQIFRILRRRGPRLGISFLLQRLTMNRTETVRG